MLLLRRYYDDRTEGNVVPCCYECNLTRRDRFTFDEMILLGKKIREIKDDR